MKFRVTSRLEELKKIGSKTKKEESIPVLGLNAELEFVAELRTLVSDSRARVYHSRLIPTVSSNREQNQREIDVILVTRLLLAVIEIKDWTGEVSLLEDFFVQKRNDGTKLLHSNPIRKTHDNLNAICQFVESKKLLLPPHRKGWVFFSRKNINFSNDICFNEIVNSDHRHLFLKSLAEKSLPLHKTAFAQSENPISTRDYENLCTSLDELSPFDLIRLRTGSIIHGKLISIIDEEGEEYKFSNATQLHMRFLNVRRNRFEIFICHSGNSRQKRKTEILRSRKYFDTGSKIRFQDIASRDLNDFDVSNVEYVTVG